MTENTNPQVPENAPDPGRIKYHFVLFHTDPYQDLFEYEHHFGGAHDRDLVTETAEWAKD